ncbi:MAG: hypothetical protein VX610_03590 [SAR324 cluster bacterium]|nr:hypothetical protein [SAR324 cluster bacterium]
MRRKICLVEMKQVVLLKKELYVEGEPEEVERWVRSKQFDETSLKWRETIEHVETSPVEADVMELPEDDGLNSLRFIQKPTIYRLQPSKEGRVKDQR